jgi:hypothetical protein
MRAPCRSRRLDAALEGRPTLRAAGDATLHLAANIVDYTYKNHPTLGPRMMEGLCILAPREHEEHVRDGDVVGRGFGGRRLDGLHERRVLPHEDAQTRGVSPAKTH